MIPLLIVGWSVAWIVARSAIAAPIRRWVPALLSMPIATIEVYISSRKTDLAPTAPIATWVNIFFSDLISCMACSGFWIGLLLAIFDWNVFDVDPARWYGAPAWVSQHSAILTGIMICGVNAALDPIVGAAVVYATSTIGKEG